MKRNLILMSGIALLLGALVACARSRPEPAERRAAVPGIDHPLTFGEVDLVVSDAHLRDNFQVSYIMHFPQSGSRFLELIVSIEGADAPLAWGVEHLALMVQGTQRELYYRRPAFEDAELATEYLFYYQFPSGSTLDEAYLQMPNGDQIDLAPFADQTTLVLVASPAPDLGTAATITT